MDLIQHVDDAAALLAALHAGPAVVIGRSTGGLIARQSWRKFVAGDSTSVIPLWS
ncbi:hypothetical protein ACTAQJ_17285 [Arthrobacter sp. alpha11c]